MRPTRPGPRSAAGHPRRAVAKPGAVRRPLLARTWTYRVAHNVATSQVIRRRASAPTLVGLDELDETPAAVDTDEALDAASRAGTPAGVGAPAEAAGPPADAPVSRGGRRRVDRRGDGAVGRQRRDEDSPHQGGPRAPLSRHGGRDERRTRSGSRCRVSGRGSRQPGGAMSLDELRRRSRRLTRAVSRRNLREYVAGGGRRARASGWAGTGERRLLSMRVGSGLIVAATIFVVYYLRRYGIGAGDAGGHGADELSGSFIAPSSNVSAICCAASGNGICCRSRRG